MQTTVFKDPHGKDSGNRMIAYVLVAIAIAVMFIMLLSTQQTAEGLTVRAYSTTEIITLFTNIMGFALTFKYSGKAQENKAMKIENSKPLTT